MVEVNTDPPVEQGAARENTTNAGVVEEEEGVQSGEGGNSVSHISTVEAPPQPNPTGTGHVASVPSPEDQKSGPSSEQKGEDGPSQVAAAPAAMAANDSTEFGPDLTIKDQDSTHLTAKLGETAKEIQPEARDPATATNEQTKPVEPASVRTDGGRNPSGPQSGELEADEKSADENSQATGTATAGGKDVEMKDAVDDPPQTQQSDANQSGSASMIESIAQQASATAADVASAAEEAEPAEDESVAKDDMAGKERATEEDEQQEGEVGGEGMQEEQEDEEDEEEGEEEGEGEGGDKPGETIKIPRGGRSELSKLGAPGAKGKVGVSGVFAPGRPTIEDDRVSRIPARLLNAELTCPICLSILRSTHTVMECMHRFCQKCIQKYLRLGQKECPKCRVKVSSRRALRPDPQFDALVHAFYPDIDAFEEKEEEFISRINAETTQMAAVVEEGLRRQANAAALGGPPRAKLTEAPAAAAAVQREERDDDDGDDDDGAGRRRKRGREPPSVSVPVVRPPPKAPRSTARATPAGVTKTLMKRAAAERERAPSRPAQPPRRRPKPAQERADARAAAEADDVEGARAERASPGPAAAAAASPDDEPGSPPVTPPPLPSVIAQRPGVVEFRLWPHPTEKRVAPLPKDYVCSVETCPMVVIKKYLAKRYFQADYRAFELLINTTEQENALIPNDLTLGTVVRMLWSRSGELKIMFRTSSQFKT